MDATNFMALDFGDKRIGVAIAHGEVRLPRPLVTIQNDQHLWEEVQRLVAENQIGTVVVGLPRGLDGQATVQTHKAEAFMQEVRHRTKLPVHAQDEAVTSVKAEAELEFRGKPYAKGSIDALAATYILEDFLNERRVH